MALPRWQATIVDASGNVQAGASVEVRNEVGGGLAALFLDRAGTVGIANPITTGVDGVAAFHVAGGAYQIVATLGPFSRTWRYVGVSTFSELADPGGGLEISGNSLQRAALTGAVAAAAGSNATTATVDLVVVIGDGVNVITTGVKGYLPIDFACTITQWTLVADVVGSIVIDVWKDTYANFPPVNADSIAGSELPTLSSVQKNQDTSLSTWTPSVAAGDVLGFNVDSASLVKQVTLALRVTKTG